MYFDIFVIYMKEIDEVLCYVRDSVKRRPSKTHTCAVLETFWSNKIKNFHEGKINGKTLEYLLQYCKGELPEGVATKWDETYYVYSPYFVNANHWVALEIDLQEWVLNVYDSNHNLMTEEHIIEELNPVMVRVPLILSLYPGTAEKYASQNAKPLRFNWVKGVKQNKRT